MVYQDIVSYHQEKSEYCQQISQRKGLSVTSETNSSAVWDPHQQQDKQRLEIIQRRAARYVANRYHNTSSVSDMLDQLEWPSLESRRTNSQLTMMYKMMKNLTNVDTSDKLIPLQSPSRNCNTLAFSIPLCKTSIRKESFYPKTTKDWNALKDVLGHRVLNLSRLVSCQ